MSLQVYKDYIIKSARQSIIEGFTHQRPCIPDPQNSPEPLLEKGACFVTLSLNQQLRGCIGSLEAHKPLAVDIANNAFAAAFSDPRFPPLNRYEVDHVDIEVSILSTQEAIDFKDEEDLLRQIQPGVDGLVIEDQGKRGTFLPTVWESLPEKKDFLNHLKLKAGLPENHWSDSIKVYRYTTELITKN
jgi:AmmeMemoRadiSam system protein A